MMNNNPTYGGPGKLPGQFKTRTPVGKLGNAYKGIPRLGNRLNVPLFGNRPRVNDGMKAMTPAFRGPAKLPSNFIKNVPGLGVCQSKSPRASCYNGPLKRRKRKTKSFS